MQKREVFGFRKSKISKTLCGAVLGTVAAMGGYTAVIGTTSAALTKERPWLQAHLSTIASGIAIVVGALILLSGFGLQVPMFG